MNDPREAEVQNLFSGLENHFQKIAEWALDSIAILDTEARFVYVNQAHGRLFGERPDLIGKPWLPIQVHEADWQRVQEVFGAAVKRGVGGRCEFRFRRADRALLYVESQTSPVQDRHGKVSHVIVVSRDITERRMAEETLRTRELQLEEAHAIINLGLWDWDLKTDALTWSSEMKRIFGVNADFQPTLTNFLALIHPDDREFVARQARGRFESGVLPSRRYRILPPDGGLRVVEIRGRARFDQTGQAIRAVGVCQDVTDIAQTQERVRSSEERLGAMVENVREYAMYTLDLEGRITSWNLGAERITGYSMQEILGKHFSCFFRPEDVERGEPDRQLEMARTRGRNESDGWRVRKSGVRFWSHIIVTPLFDTAGNVQGYSKITHDISERRRAEEDLRSYADRLRVTSRRLVEIQEAERRTLANELHDRVGQNLTALGLNLSLIGGALPTDVRPELAARIEESGALVRKTVDAIRNVMGELRPQVLDDYGLPAALRLLATGFSKRTGIEVNVSAAADTDRVPEAVHLAMYRIAQEALNNVSKHSGASRADICLAGSNNCLILSVSDDGAGFKPEQVGPPDGRNRGWGLLIMRERAEAVGAQFRFDADSTRGVRIHVEYRI